MLEIERTYLVAKAPSGLAHHKSAKIKQGYISHEPEPLRIRQKGDKFELTKKFPVNGSVTTQEEINLPLTKEEFDKLWPLTVSSLEKIRYFIPIADDLTAELDVFEGKLAGYMVVEVEFTSEEQMSSFVPPDWFGPDVSVEDISSSRKLSKMTMEEVTNALKKRGSTN